MQENSRNNKSNKKFKIPLLLTDPSILSDGGKISWEKFIKCIKINKFLNNKNLLSRREIYLKKQRTAIFDTKRSNLKIKKSRFNLGQKLFEIENKRNKFLKKNKKREKNNSVDIFNFKKRNSFLISKQNYNKSFSEFLKTEKNYFRYNKYFHEKLKNHVKKKKIFIYSRSFSNDEKKIKCRLNYCFVSFEKMYYYYYVKFFLKNFNKKHKLKSFWKKLSFSEIMFLDKKIFEMFGKSESFLKIEEFKKDVIFKNENEKKNKNNFKSVIEKKNLPKIKKVNYFSFLKNNKKSEFLEGEYIKIINQNFINKEKKKKKDLKKKKLNTKKNIKKRFSKTNNKKTEEMFYSRISPKTKFLNFKVINQSNSKDNNVLLSKNLKIPKIKINIKLKNFEKMSPKIKENNLFGNFQKINSMEEKIFEKFNHKIIKEKNFKNKKFFSSLKNNSKEDILLSNIKINNIKLKKNRNSSKEKKNLKKKFSEEKNHLLINSTKSEKKILFSNIKINFLKEKEKMLLINKKDLTNKSTKSLTKRSFSKKNTLKFYLDKSKKFLNKKINLKINFEKHLITIFKSKNKIK